MSDYQLVELIRHRYTAARIVGLFLNIQRIAEMLGEREEIDGGETFTYRTERYRYRVIRHRERADRVGVLDNQRRVLVAAHDMSDPLFQFVVPGEWRGEIDGLMDEVCAIEARRAADETAAKRQVLLDRTLAFEDGGGVSAVLPS